MRLIIVSVLFGLTAQFVMKENVIFQKVKEVTTVRARWMVTFVEDLLMLQRNMVKCNCHRLEYLVLHVYNKRVIALILRHIVPRSISYCNRKLVQ